MDHHPTSALALCPSRLPLCCIAWPLRCSTSPWRASQSKACCNFFAKFVLAAQHDINRSIHFSTAPPHWGGCVCYILVAVPEVGYFPGHAATVTAPTLAVLGYFGQDNCRARCSKVIIEAGPVQQILFSTMASIAQLLHLRTQGMSSRLLLIAMALNGLAAVGWQLWQR